MTTEKYDLHTIDYSVQGWDAILATDMEILDDVVPSREVVTLGETINAYDALMLKSDGKWYKAKADGILQPCMGLALEAGVVSDQIRIQRMGLIENANWNWTTVGETVYLSPTVAGGLTTTKPSSNVQIIGYVVSATSILLHIEAVQSSGGITKFSQGGTLYNPDGITTGANLIVWEALFSCKVTNVKGYRVGGTGATINARKNGTSNHLSSDLSLTSENTWMDGGSVQNENYSAGDKLEIMIVTVSGGPTQIAVKVDFELV